MTKTFLCILFGLTAAIASAQSLEAPPPVIDTAMQASLNKKLSAKRSHAEDSIAWRYQNDTLGIKTYPMVQLYDSIVPNKFIGYWEVAKCYSMGENEFRYERMYVSKEQKYQGIDSGILVKSQRGFGTSCPPGWCVDYIGLQLAPTKAVALTDLRGLHMFIGAIDNAYDAFFWLSVNAYKTNASLSGYELHFSRYKRVKGGYLIIFHSWINDCPSTNADLLYFVGLDRKIVFVQALQVVRGSGCV